MYYRPDKIKNITTSIRKIKIKKNMGWCDDPNSMHYNKQIKLPSKFSHEKLYRKDNLYDLFLVLNYNTNPVIKNKGSAIFLHIAKKNYKPTAGCIALKKEDLRSLLSVIKKGDRIKIN
jgi:L,D-peptidoglycan transpeptidase YkuD (ErfK/YbiS/YcfS/YnhG family)